MSNYHMITHRVIQHCLNSLSKLQNHIYKHTGHIIFFGGETGHIII